MEQSWCAFFGSVALVLLSTPTVRGEEVKAELSVAAQPGEWRYLNSDPMSTRYSPLEQINKDNFKDLKIAWRTGDRTCAFVARRNSSGQWGPNTRNLSQ
jgi:quinoprotein glucose dehydrogenase